MNKNTDFTQHKERFTLQALSPRFSRQVVILLCPKRAQLAEVVSSL